MINLITLRAEPTPSLDLKQPLAIFNTHGEYFCAVPKAGSEREQVHLYMAQWGHIASINLDRAEVEQLIRALGAWVEGTKEVKLEDL